MTRPLLLDLFCGAGGAAVGYHRAGFDVVGVDTEPQPDYPFHFHQADALDFPLTGFDVIHASPPCPAYSTITRNHARANHPDLVAPTRQLLQAWGGPYVIENVPGAPLDHPLMLCGASFGLGATSPDGTWRPLRRHRLFESNVPLMSPGCMCSFKEAVGIYGGKRGWGRNERRPNGQSRGYRAATQTEANQALGTPWITRPGATSNAIPPAYTQHIGEQLNDHLTHQKNATPPPERNP